jgi:hypothetical protein
MEGVRIARKLVRREEEEKIGRGRRVPSCSFIFMTAVGIKGTMDGRDLLIFVADSWERGGVDGMVRL